MATISGETAATWSGMLTVEYSQNKGVIGVGNCLKSSVFSVEGHGWRIEYYPDGDTQTNADWVCFALCLDRLDAEENVEVEAQFVFSLLDQFGAPVPAYTVASGVCTFSSNDPSWGSERFIERRELEASPYLRDGSFSVRCYVTVLKTKAKDPMVAVPALELASEVEEEDLMVEVDKQAMEAHMSPLVARSSVGWTELYGLRK